VWGVHGVGGFLGITLLGIFGSRLWNPAGSDGLIYGGTRFFMVQVVSAILCSLWAFVFTYGFLWLISRVTVTKVAPDVEEAGLDITLHGEEAYPVGL